MKLKLDFGTLLLRSNNKMGMNWYFIVTTVLLAMLCCGCKRNNTTVPNPPPPVIIQDQAPTSQEDAFKPATSSAVIAGKIIYNGPKVELMAFAGDPLPPGTKTLVEDIWVNQDGTISNVLVYVKEGLQNQLFTVPTKPLFLDYRSYRFDPHVLAVQVGQPIVIRNCDDAFHHVYLTTSQQWNFNNFQIFKVNSTNSAVFNKPEIGIQLRDYRYPSMNGYIHIISHPFFNVTNFGGVYRIEGLPAGTYILEAWHEKLGVKQIEVIINDSKLIRLDITYEK